MRNKALVIGSISIGGNSPVRVESMLKTPLEDLDGSLSQLRSLDASGCEMVRVAFPSLLEKHNLASLLKESPVEIMADIHFDPALAEAAIVAGCRSIRINPGNMGSTDRLDRLIDLAKDRGVAIRIGANSGSVSPRQVKDAGGSRSAGLALAVEEQLRALEDRGFEDVILSAKSTDVTETVEANKILHSKYGNRYPFHIGITESGSGVAGIVKSSVGLGILLSLGIGDTVRVSLSDRPENEVLAGFEILKSLGLRQRGPEIISCPTCGRKKLDVVAILPEIRPLLEGLPDGFKVAIMGCEVNGPQEARHADVGVAGSLSEAVFFKKGEIVDRRPLPELVKGMSLLLEPYRLKS